MSLVIARVQLMSTPLCILATDGCCSA